MNNDIYQITFIFVYEDRSYIGVAYIKVFRIRHGVVEVLVLLGWLVTDFSILVYRFRLSRVEQFKTILTLEDRTDGCPETPVSCYQLKPLKIP
jgi:hypothetical protein